MEGFAQRTRPFWTRVIEFMLYSFCGWSYEMVAEGILAGHLVSRGWLHLPMCIIYGFFSIVVLQVFKPEKNKPVSVFFLSMAIVTVMEYLSALLIEAVLHRKLWDYSRWICNFQGRVSLISSLIFGTACVLLVFWVHPAVNKFFNKKTSPAVTAALGAVLLCVTVIDTSITALGY